MGAQGLEKRGLKAGDFKFDIEEGGRVVAGEDPVEVWQINKFAGSGASDFNFVDGGVVADKRATVRGAAHVELEAVAAVGEGQVKRRERVFRDNAGGAGAAVAEEEHVGILAEGRRHHATPSCRLRQ
jgi:hypothetical protein